jgi:hypothetical protein
LNWLCQQHRCHNWGTWWQAEQAYGQSGGFAVHAYDYI